MKSILDRLGSAVGRSLYQKGNYTFRLVKRHRMKLKGKRKEIRKALCENKAEGFQGLANLAARQYCLFNSLILLLLFNSPAKDFNLLQFQRFRSFPDNDILRIIRKLVNEGGSIETFTRENALRGSDFNDQLISNLADVVRRIIAISFKFGATSHFTVVSDRDISQEAKVLKSYQRLIGNNLAVVHELADFLAVKGIQPRDNLLHLLRGFFGIET